MKYYVFNYYDKFHCIGSRCKHNCCTDWEINIDKKTLKKYKKLKGDFTSGIDFENGKFKKVGKRCAFLDSDNLCRIIKTSGEKSLCQVCSDHPRFKNFFSGETETGLGLSCEEACRIILSEEDKQELILKEARGRAKKDKPFELKIKEFRGKLLNVIENESEPILLRLEKLREISGFTYKDGDLKFWTEFYKKTDILFGDFGEYLSLAKDGVLDGFDKEIKNLTSYFIYRHVSRAQDITDLYIKTAFCYLSVKIITAILFGKKEKYESISFDDFVEVSRCYSAEIEYSDDNTENITCELEKRINMLAVSKLT